MTGSLRNRVDLDSPGPNRPSSVGPAHLVNLHNFAYNNYPPDLGGIENVDEIFNVLHLLRCSILVVRR